MASANEPFEAQTKTIKKWGRYIKNRAHLLWPSLISKPADTSVGDKDGSRDRAPPHDLDVAGDSTRLGRFLRSILLGLGVDQTIIDQLKKYRFKIPKAISPSHSLLGKMLVYNIVPVVILFSILWYFVVKHELKTLDQEAEKLIADFEVSLISEVQHELDMLSGSVDLIGQMQTNVLFSKREQSIDFLKQILATNPTFIASFVGYEPDADAQDFRFENQALNSTLVEALSMGKSSNAEGRFLPIWERAAPAHSGIPLSVQTGNIQDMSARTTLALRPFHQLIYSENYQTLKTNYQRQGKVGAVFSTPYEANEQMIFEIMKPIIIDGSFRGVAGIHQMGEVYDRKLAGLAPAEGEREFVDFYLISPSKRFVASSKDPRQLRGKFLTITHLREEIEPLIDRILREAAMPRTRNLELGFLDDEIAEEAENVRASGASHAGADHSGMHNPNMHQAMLKRNVSSPYPLDSLWTLLLASVDDKNSIRYYAVQEPISGWIFVTAFNYASILAPFQANVTKYSAIAIGLVLTIILLQFMVLSNFSKRLQKTLNGYRHLIADYKLSATDFEINTKDEIGKLNRFLVLLYDLRRGISDICTAFASGDFSKKMPFDADMDIFRSIDLMRHNRQGVEQSLRSSLHLLDQMINTDRLSFAYKDHLGRYQLVNEGWQKTTGILSKDALDRTDFDLFDNSIAELIYNEDYQVSSQLTTVEGRTQIMIKGAPHIFEYVKYPIFHEDGHYVGVSFIGIDVTDYYTVQDSLSEQLDQLTRIFNAVPYPILFLSNTAEIRMANPALEALFDIKQGQLAGKSLENLPHLSKSDAKHMHLESRRAIQNSGHIQREITITLGDQRAHNLVYHAQGFTNEAGQPLGLIATFFDITENREIEEHLVSQVTEFADAKRASLNMLFDLERERKFAEELRVKAEAATRAKANFLAAMSHEIRTPMNGVIGMIDLLRETQLDEDQSLMMRTVRDSAFSLLQIINDILDFSKIEAGKMLLETIPISVRDIVEGVCETLVPGASKKSLKLYNWIDPTLPNRMEGDQVRLRQILFNLLGNAIKFTESSDDHQGVVYLRAFMFDKSEPFNPSLDFTQPDTKIAGPVLVFQIEDNGVGMSPAVVAKLFQPFTQAESSTTRRFGGTGLGLTISRNLVDLMNGEIFVDSVEGKGSTFSIVVPLKPAPDNEADIEPSLASSKMLVMINDPISREICVNYLNAFQADVDNVSDDEQILQRLSKQDESKQDEKSASAPYDVIVTDRTDSHDDLIAKIRFDVNIQPIKFVLLNSDRRMRRWVMQPDMVLVEDMPIRRSLFLRGVGVAAGKIGTETEAVHFNQKSKLAVPTIEEAALKHQLILVAEDNITNQDVIKRQLSTLGFACEIANNGREALDMLKRRKYNVLLTDCHMPVMDGYELTKVIRKHEAELLDHMPIIAITANALQGEGDRCLEIGMNDYLAKPLEMEHLKQVLRRWLPSEAQDDMQPNQDTNLAAPHMFDEAYQAERPKHLIDVESWKSLNHTDSDMTLLLTAFTNAAKDFSNIIGDEQQQPLLGQYAMKLHYAAAAIYALKLQEVAIELKQVVEDSDSKKDDIEEMRAEVLNLIFKTLLFLRQQFDSKTLDRAIQKALDEIYQTQSVYFSPAMGLLKDAKRSDSTLNLLLEDAGAKVEDSPPPARLPDEDHTQDEDQAQDVNQAQDDSQQQDDPQQQDKGENAMNDEVPAVNPVNLLRDFDNDRELIKEILEGFVESAGDNLKEIQDAITAKDAKQAGMAGHKMKSAARAIGADRLADLCRDIEKHGKADELGALQTLQSQLDPVYDAVVKSIHDFK
ncbi:MAG: response regulator [Alphaproteobacteria bacterium]